jgi:Neuraminidase (sialidase)
MHGSLSGNVWSGEWMNSPTDIGQFNFKLGNDDSFTGTYKYASKEGNNPWYSTRLKRRHIDVK